MVALSSRTLGNRLMHEVGLKPRERAIIVAVVRKGTNPDIVSEHLDELEQLLDTAGADVALRIYQERVRPETATAIGTGKLQELKEFVELEHASMVVFDDELTPLQVRNLEKELNVKVLDRSGVILDIFAANARSVESKTQVELAQLEYLLPRLTRMWTHLSKQFGGIGTKGPGETQIETDRRMYRTRIQRLKEKLNQLDVQREVQRKGREGLPRFALVGYTNAGKSSLMQAISQAEVLVEDRLFATLDSTVRAFSLPNGKRALLSDTVGFIRKLPPQLVASFRSTLAETVEADVLLHVVDASNPFYPDHIAVVEETLTSLGAHSIPTILVFNKSDLVHDQFLLADLGNTYPGCIAVSAVTGHNIDVLLQRMVDVADRLSTMRSLVVPWENMQAASKIYDLAEVIERTDGDEGMSLSVKISSDKLAEFEQRFAAYLVAVPQHTTS
ncbi:MAG: GTPase HflX [Bradyrhizobiaceae bacterium]|nr:GTPase HflX [Bradyrhizobiaceae bacterium]